MEYVEGESPAGPLPIDQAMEIARQIAEALSEAHEKGIVHRDLKPANIKIKHDGTVKVLDFGLAKIGGGPADSSSEDSPTISMAATQAGVILGTAAYMAREQARGKRVDARADIWAFGVVLYELITGQRLFKGEDLTETLASVVKEQPDLSAVPPRVRRLLEACLQKDPKKRLQAIGDMRLVLEAQSPRRHRRGWAEWADVAWVDGRYCGARRCGTWLRAFPRGAAARAVAETVDSAAGKRRGRFSGNFSRWEACIAVYGPRRDRPALPSLARFGRAPAARLARISPGPLSGLRIAGLSDSLPSPNSK